MARSQPVAALIVEYQRKFTKRGLRMNIGVGTLIAAMVVAGSGHCQEYPSKPIRMIVPATAGGNTDFMARAISQKITEGLGQPVVIEYRPGGGTNIGSEAVAKAAPDGYTLLVGQSALSANMTLYRKVNYDTVRDFAPITMVLEGQLALLIHPSVPVTSVRELVALAKAQPGKLTYATGGIGLSTHLAMEPNMPSMFSAS